MKLLAPLALLLAVALGAVPAFADAMPPPCTGKMQGDPCTDLMNHAGTCQPGAGSSLTCVTTMTTTSSTGTGGSAGTGGSTGTGAGTGGGSSGSGSSGGSCAVSPQEAGAGGFIIAGLALAALLRSRGSRRGAGNGP